MPGHVKTRLCPPCTPAQAAALAEAALRDTLAAAAGVADELAIVLDGSVGPWVPAGARVVAQRGDGLDERLANAFADLGGADADRRAWTRLSSRPRCCGARSPRSSATTPSSAPRRTAGTGASACARPHPGALLGVPMSVDRDAGRPARAPARARHCDVARGRHARRRRHPSPTPRTVAAAAPATRFARAYRAFARPCRSRMSLLDHDEPLELDLAPLGPARLPPPTRPCSTAPPGRSSTSAAAPAATSARSRAAASSRSGSTPRRRPRAAPARTAPRSWSGRSSTRCPARARGGPCCCWTARRDRRRARRAAAPRSRAARAGWRRRSSRPSRRRDDAHRASASCTRAAPPFPWALVGADDVPALARLAGLEQTDAGRRTTGGSRRSPA